jgi:hypothetical protein
MTTDQLIDAVEMYVSDRQIRIAEMMATEFSNKNSNSPLLESGFAILSVIVSYFEMIAQFINGEDSENKSKLFFVQGFQAVYPRTPLSEPVIKDKIYKQVRCGMYHGGMTKAGVHISRHFSEGFTVQGREIYINPAKVVEEIKQHFTGYMASLRNNCKPLERQNFDKLCRDIGADLPVSDTVTINNASGIVTTCHTTPSPFHPGDGDRK